MDDDIRIKKSRDLRKEISFIGLIIYPIIAYLICGIDIILNISFISGWIMLLFITLIFGGDYK